LRFLYFVVPFSTLIFAVPKLILSVGFPDANNLLAGVLSLKAFKVFKSNSINDCLSTINQMDDKVDVVLTDKESAIANDFFLVNRIKAMAPDTMIVIIADSDNDGEWLPNKNIDEVVVRPISPENLADKILNMLARKELKRLKS
jgi:response regulator RpfG family c-di-GMP phosphodiesterase